MIFLTDSTVIKIYIIEQRCHQTVHFRCWAIISSLSMWIQCSSVVFVGPDLIGLFNIIMCWITILVTILLIWGHGEKIMSILFSRKKSLTALYSSSIFSCGWCSRRISQTCFLCAITINACVLAVKPNFNLSCNPGPFTLAGRAGDNITAGEESLLVSSQPAALQRSPVRLTRTMLESQYSKLKEYWAVWVISSCSRSP
jgi:hypothetical protein